MSGAIFLSWALCTWYGSGIPQLVAVLPVLSRAEQYAGQLAALVLGGTANNPGAANLRRLSPGLGQYGPTSIWQPDRCLGPGMGQRLDFLTATGPTDVLRTLLPEVGKALMHALRRT